MARCAAQTCTSPLDNTAGLTANPNPTGTDTFGNFPNAQAAIFRAPSDAGCRPYVSTFRFRACFNHWVNNIELCACAAWEGGWGWGWGRRAGRGRGGGAGAGGRGRGTFCPGTHARHRFHALAFAAAV